MPFIIANESNPDSLLINICQMVERIIVIDSDVRVRSPALPLQQFFLDSLQCLLILYSVKAYTREDLSLFTFYSLFLQQSKY